MCSVPCSLHVPTVDGLFVQMAKDGLWGAAIDIEHNQRLYDLTTPSGFVRLAAHTGIGLFNLQTVEQSNPLYCFLKKA